MRRLQHHALLACLFPACMALVCCARQAAPPSAPPPNSPPPAIAYEAHVAAGGIVPAGGVLRNPHEGDAAVARNGGLLFTAMNCDGCHGASGSG